MCPLFPLRIGVGHKKRCYARKKPAQNRRYVLDCPVGWGGCIKKAVLNLVKTKFKTTLALIKYIF